jgi:hypothetical protein
MLRMNRLGISCSTFSFSAASIFRLLTSVGFGLSCVGQHVSCSDQLPIATDGYGPLVEIHIVVVCIEELL